MRRAFKAVFVLTLLLIPAVLIAQDDALQDAEGCKDSPIITRMPGSTIHSCERRSLSRSRCRLQKTLTAM